MSALSDPQPSGLQLASPEARQHLTQPFARGDSGAEGHGLGLSIADSVMQQLGEIAHVKIVRVRSFDVATFVAFGAAQLGVAGNDVLMEFDYPEVYAPLDLGIGKCRMSVAEPVEMQKNDDPSRWSHVRVATKYPNITRRHFAARGVQAECVELSGAMELAPNLGLASRIVDLVETGSTLKANGLVEVEHIAHITSRLAVNRAALKTRPDEMGAWIERFRDAVAESVDADAA